MTRRHSPCARGGVVNVLGDGGDGCRPMKMKMNKMRMFIFYLLFLNLCCLW